MKINLRRIFSLLPLLAPIPEAYAIFLSIDKELGWDKPIIVIASLIVAGTGFWGVQVRNNFDEFNATLKAAEINQKMELPTHKATWVLVVWFVGVTLLTVFLDLWPILLKLTPLGLVVIGFSAAYLFSLSNLYESRVKERDAHREAKEKKREDTRAESKARSQAEKKQAQELAIIEKTIRASGKASKRPAKGKMSDAMLLMAYRSDPFMDNQQVADWLVEKGHVDSISRQAIGPRKKKLVESGVILVTDEGRVVEYAQVGEGAAESEVEA